MFLFLPLQCVHRYLVVNSCCLERTTCAPTILFVHTRTNSTYPTLRPACPSMSPDRTTVTCSIWGRFTHRPLSTSSDIIIGRESSISLKARTVSVWSDKGVRVENKRELDECISDNCNGLPLCSLVPWTTTYRLPGSPLWKQFSIGQLLRDFDKRIFCHTYTYSDRSTISSCKCRNVHFKYHRLKSSSSNWCFHILQKNLYFFQWYWKYPLSSFEIHSFI